MDAKGDTAQSSGGDQSAEHKTATKPKARSRKKDGSGDGEDSSKRRCVSTACIACRRRKSKCDGNLPACAACSSVYNTECVYDPNSDHRRKGVYRKEDKLKTRNSTLDILIQAILNVSEEQVAGLVRQIRTCESLDTVAEAILENGTGFDEDDDLIPSVDDPDMQSPTFESQLSTNTGELRMEDGSTRYIGGTSNLIFLGEIDPGFGANPTPPMHNEYQHEGSAITSWTNVTNDPELIMHLLNMYFTWHYTYFTTLSKSLFFRDFRKGCPSGPSRNTEYCTPLLVNAMLALGCHFTGWPAGREIKDDAATAGNHFFREAKYLIMANDEYEKPKLATVQALALMSVREAGCGREAKGWVYSGMSFRMACDLGLNLDSGALAVARESGLSDEEIDARRITFWGCFLFDKCWSNYLGRLPQLPPSIITVPKFDVFPIEDSEIWAAYTDSGFNQSHAQPSRTRAVALQISSLCEISNDLMSHFYNPIEADKPKAKHSELKKLSDIHQRLEAWRRNLPVEMEPKEGGLPGILVMHMFFQLLYIHLFRPFLKYSQSTSPLPPNVSPRRLCTQAAAAISKLLRLYKRSHGLRQICNIAVYIANSACTIHLLNLPDKNAKRDITHGVKHLEEIAESWLCARRTLAIISVLSRQWKVELPDEAAAVLARTDARFSAWNQDIQARDPARLSASMSPHPPVASPARIQQIVQPSPNFFRTMTVSGDEMASVSASAVPRNALPPPDMHPRPARLPASQPSLSSPASASAQHSVETTGSPSALFGGVEQLLRDSQDWWVRDQNQLAMGFGHWPREGDVGWLSNGLGGGAVSGGGVSVGVGAGGSSGGGGGIVSPTTAQFAADDGGLAALFAGINGSGAMGAMGYPNESEWYQ